MLLPEPGAASVGDDLVQPGVNAGCRGGTHTRMPGAQKTERKKGASSQSSKERAKQMSVRHAGRTGSSHTARGHECPPSACLSAGADRYCLTSMPLRIYQTLSWGCEAQTATAEEVLGKEGGSYEQGQMVCSGAKALEWLSYAEGQ